MNYKIKNGLFYLEDGDGLVIPTLNEETDDNVILDKKVSSFVYENISGDFEMSACFIPEHMSFTDSFGIVIETPDGCGYVKSEANEGGNGIKSGMTGLFDFENPKQFLGKEKVYLKIVRQGCTYNTFFSEDGKNYNICGSFELESDEIKAGFEIESFQGSSFAVKVTDIQKYANKKKNVA